MLKILTAILTVAALLIPGAALVAENTVSAPQPAQITAQEAEKAALDHAGLTAEDVTGLHSRYDAYERIPHWDVEFFSADYEYDYEIDSTGAVLEWSKDYEGRQAPAVPTPTEPAAPVQSAAAITAEEAKAVALEHAGLTEAQVTRLQVKRDWDDGVPQYEVEFRQGRMEYEYDIHAETGKILSWDKDYDD